MLNSIKLLLFISCLILLNSACSKDRKAIQPVSLTAQKKIMQFNDTTFFGDIWDMALGKHGSIYIMDNTSRVFHVGPNMELIGQLIKKGKGPGEFIGISAMGFANDSLYVYSAPQAKIAVFDDKDHFIREIKIPYPVVRHIAIDKHSHIFLSTPFRKHLITEIDAHGHLLRTFGENTVKKSSVRIHFERNQRMLFVHKDKLIAVGVSEPLVAAYTLNGKLINKTKITPPLLQGFIARIKKENTVSRKQSGFNSFALLFSDAVIFKNNLYVVEQQHLEEHAKVYAHKYTTLFKYKLNPDGSVSLKEVFKLFRKDHKKLLVGNRLAILKGHKLIVGDWMSGGLLIFKDKHL